MQLIKPFNDFFDTDAMKASYNYDMWKEYKGDILAYYSELLDDYLKNIRLQWDFSVNPALSGMGKHLGEIYEKAKTLGEAIKETLRYFLKGDVYLGTQQHSQLFEALDKCLDINRWNDVLFSNRHPCLERRLFRVRILKDNVVIRSREDMFHVPASKRHLIGSNRFSILGYPCLYLSSSLYCCWEEMGRPPFHKIVFSRFELQQEAPHKKILFICIDPKIWQESTFGIKSSIEFLFPLLKTFLINYPLQLACSIPTRNERASFHSEYIIPQILMGWLRSARSTCSGICYRTTHIPQVSTNRIHPLLLYNYALPAKSLENSEFCTELGSMFHLTEPVLFELTCATSRRKEDGGIPYLGEGFSDDLDNWDFSPTNVLPNYQSFYGSTDFARAEKNSVTEETKSVFE